MGLKLKRTSKLLLAGKKIKIMKISEPLPYLC